MRRRLVALGIVLSVVVVAFVAAYSLPSPQAAQVPDESAALRYGEAAKPVAKRIVVARLEGHELLLPVQQDASTAVAFHPVDDPSSIGMAPVGERVAGGDLGTRLADIFAGGGQLQYYLMDGTEGEQSASTAGLDVGAVPGAAIYGPADGRVIAVKSYELLGRYPDVQVSVQLAADPSLVLVMTHVAAPQVHVGDEVKAGSTVLGSLRAFPDEVEQRLRQYTNDAGDHVQIVAMRVTPDLAGF